MSVMTKLNHKRQTAAARLAKGQLWKVKHVYIYIVELGDRLLSYKMMDFLGQDGVRAKMSGVDVMWRYLQSRHARLLKAGGLV